MICALAGDDHIYGGAGNDVIYGGEGDDHVSPGLGNDTVYGERGSDGVNDFGRGGGADRIFGGPDQDGILDGGPGNDRIDSGSDGLEWVDGGSGNDRIIAGAAGIISGGPGNDILFGASLLPVPPIFGSRVYGDEGNDIAILLDGQHDSFVRGRNPLLGEPSVDLPLAACAVSVDLNEDRPGPSSISCPLVDGVFSASLDSEGRLAISGSGFDDMLRFKFRDLGELATNGIAGDICICDPTYGPNSVLWSDSIEDGA